MDPRIADYIRANRKQYTREAITKQLLEAGHDPAEVERTWAALDTRDPDAVAGEGFWPRFALIVVGINLGVLLVVGLLSGALQFVASGGFIMLAILGIALAIGGLMAWGIVAATGPARMGRTTALIIGIVIPLVFALLIGGTCYALIGGIGGGFGPPPTNGAMQVALGPPLEMTEELPATCQPNGPDPAAGWSAYANLADEDGRYVDVSVSAYPTRPGGPLQPSVYITVTSPNEPERPLGWSNDGPVSPIELEIVGGAQSGSIAFDGLVPMQDDPGGTLGDPLSGEISWTCE